MDTEAEAFEAAAAEVSDRAALRRQIDVLHQEIARLAARPTAARVLMDTLEKVCPWLWQEVVGSDLDPCVGAADPEKIPVLLRAVLDRITGGPPMEAETWQVVCVGRREQEERIFVDVRTRRTREHRLHPGKYLARARYGTTTGSWSWSTSGMDACGDDPRVLCSRIAGQMCLSVVRILSPEQIDAENAT